MHTYKSQDGTFTVVYNSDLSGPVKIISEVKGHDEDPGWVDGDKLREFMTHWIGIHASPLMLVNTREPIIGEEYEAGAWSRRNWEAALRDQRHASDGTPTAVNDCEHKRQKWRIDMTQGTCQDCKAVLVPTPMRDEKCQ